MLHLLPGQRVWEGAGRADCCHVSQMLLHVLIRHHELAYHVGSSAHFHASPAVDNGLKYSTQIRAHVLLPTRARHCPRYWVLLTILVVRPRVWTYAPC